MAAKTEDTVTITLPRAAHGEENFVIASLNGRAYKIKRGTPVEVPKGIAEILQNADQAQAQLDEYAEENANH